MAKAKKPVKTDYTREELIDICERACVKQDDWGNRDSESAQRQVGDCWALLRAGCEFEILTSESDGINTDHKTIWLVTYSQGFNYYEGYCSWDDDDPKDYMTRETHYLPTPERLKASAGKDWY